MQTKQCTKCHRAKSLDEFPRDSSKRDGRGTWCRECKRAANRERYAARREEGLCRVFGCPKRAAPDRTRCADHLAADAARAAAWRAANPEKYREYHRARYAADPEKERERARARIARLSARTDDEIADDLAAVLAESPDGLLPCRAGHHAPAEDFSVDRSRRSGRHDYCREHDAESKARRRSDARARLLARWEERDLFTCTFCGGEYEHIEHLLARRNGGPDVSQNLAPACARCNSEKYVTPVDVWLDRLAAAGDPRGVAREVWAAWPRIYLDVTEDGTVVNVETGEVVEEAE